MERISRDNAALCLIDHQVGLVTGVRDFTVGEFEATTSWVSPEPPQLLGLPVIVATTAKDQFWGPTIPELGAALKGNYTTISTA